MNRSTGFPAEGGALGALMRATDWSATPLGDPDGWSPSLRTAVRMCLASRFPLFLWWGPQLTTLYNDAYGPLLGDKHPAALGQPASGVWSEIWDIIGPLAGGVMERGEATWSQDQLLLLERSGYPEECYFDFAYSPVDDEQGAIGGLFGVVSETTGRVLGARRLRTLGEVAARTRGVGEVERVVSRAVAALDVDRRDLPFALLYTETGDRRRLLAATGLTARQERRLREDAAGGPVVAGPLRPAQLDGAILRRETLLVTDPRPLELLPDADRPACDKALILPVDDGGQSSANLVLVCGLSANRALDEDLRQFCELVAAAIGTAVADADAFAQERRRARALAELDRARTDFVSNVSHELRTPLTLMLGPLEDAICGRDPEPDLAMVHRNAQRLLKHVGRLLEFSRLPGDRVQADRRPVDLAAACTELASVFRSAIERAGLRLEVDCEPSPAPVLVDPDHLEQILINLLSNALKFTFAGSITVRVGADGAGGGVVEVSDTGVGIAPEELPRLFERFHRVPGARSRTYEGSGIGLALVKELTELQEGRVAVASEPGRGTRFTVTLPLAGDGVAGLRPAASPRADAFASEALRWSEAGTANAAVAAGVGPEPGTPVAAAAPGGGAARSRVLVIDDNADMRQYLRRLLCGAHEVVLAADGREGLERLRADGADLVLSDVMMPALDGTGVVRAIRADPALAATPVILLSARAGEEASVAGLGAGADDYVVKPFGARELLARVAANLELGAMRNAEARRATEHAGRLQALLRREHRITEALQRSLLPPALAGDPFTLVAGHYEPAQESVQVGGDFYDAITLEDGGMLLVVGDVAGHGLAAAAVMGQLRAAVRGAVLRDPRPGPLLEHLNDVVCRLEQRPMVTCQCVVLEPDAAHAQYVTAGHPPGMLIGADGTVTALGQGAGPALGLLRTAQYPTQRLALAPDTVVLLYTDGLVERRGEAIDAGIARLAARAAGLRHREPAAIAEALVAAERRDRVFDDDVAVLVAGLRAPSGHLRMDLPASAESLGLVRRSLRRWLSAHELAADDAHDVLLACHEAATNVVEHAYGLLPGRLRMELRGEDGTVRVSVGDTGSWRAPREEEHGRGLMVMRGSMDEVEVTRGPHGSTVTMVRRCATRVRT